MRPARKPARSVVGSAGRGSRSWAEELLAVAAAEQKDEPLQVTVQFVQAVGEVASELFPVRAAGAGYLSHNAPGRRLPCAERDAVVATEALVSPLPDGSSSR